MARRIAIITDVHANLPALEAALGAVEALGCDEIVHTGDAIGIGPFPGETLERLLATPRMRFVMGNHDAWFANGLSEPRPTWMSEGELGHHQWVYAQLTPGHRRAVARWPYEIVAAYQGTHVLFTHYARPDRQGGFASIVHEPTPSDLDDLFGDTSADIVFYGHHHPQSDLTGRSRYVNPGALGCHDRALARFALLTIDSDGTREVRFHEAAYDPSPLLRELEAREVPDRELIRKAFLRFPG